MSDVIKLLPDHVANQIAAGEVIQRPASVVKELMENAIDAKASEIKLVIKDAGKTLIQVIDNGMGMSPTDARLSFERHATSKIRSAEDLLQIGTKGFRGEALASIAAVAHVEMNTKREGADLGVQLKIEGSQVISQDVAACPLGTSVAVKHLFFNIPARRKFLKSDKIEFRHIIDEFQRVALPHPNVHFRMYNNSGELFNLPPANLKQRIAHLFGSKNDEKWAPVQENTPLVKIIGFIGKPEYARKVRGEQFFFVNNRFIKSPYLHHAVVNAYEGLIKPEMHPGYFLYLEIDPASIDINIHPTKTEIKFDDEQTLYSLLRSAVKHSLGQFNIAPALDFEKPEGLDLPYSYKNREASLPAIEVDAHFNPFEEKPKAPPTVKFKNKVSKNWEDLYVGVPSKLSAERPFSTVEVESEEMGELFDDKKEEISTGMLHQFHKKYIITTIKSAILIIHQQRAHQRVLYEQFLQNITIKQALSQQLLFPIILTYTTNHIHLLKELQEWLTQVGFVIRIKKNTAEITGIPVGVTEQEISPILDQLLLDLQDNISGNGFSQTDFFAKSLCKSLAVKTGESLSAEAQEALVNNLFACKEPGISPFNEPVYTTITVEEVDKKL